MNNSTENNNVSIYSYISASILLINIIFFTGLIIFLMSHAVSNYLGISSIKESLEKQSASIIQKNEHSDTTTPVSSNHNASGNPESELLTKGKALYATCLACHGQNAEGNKILNSPILSGQQDWYLKAQLVKFRDGLRGVDKNDIQGAMMRPMALVLKDENDIDAVVAYITTLTANKPEPTIQGDIKKGEQSYAICITCHGADGKGNKSLNSPSITGLNDWYMATQLKNFKNGIRGSDPKDVTGAQMRAMALTLQDDEAINNVISYINQLGK